MTEKNQPVIARGATETEIFHVAHKLHIKQCIQSASISPEFFDR